MNRISFRHLFVASSLTVLAACGPAPGTTEPSPSPTATAIPAPQATATPAPETTPTPAPETTATPAPETTPTPTATLDPAATATPAPLPTAQDDISVIEKTTFNGKVYDDTNAPLDGVKVTAKSLNGSVDYSVETTTAGGTYAFNNAPAGVQLEIIASRPGYTTRRRVEVLKSNKQGDPNANRYDFGTTGGEATDFGTEFNALSDRPEVVMVTPGRNASGINPTTSFVLKFSEPMDRQTVTDAFQIRAFGAQSEDFRITGRLVNGEQLSVDNEPTFDNGFATDGQLVYEGDLIWDKGAFNTSWNSDDTEVTLTFKEERALPTDKDTDNLPDYSVSFQAGEAGIKDKSGITRDEKHFKLTDGRFENYYKFSITTDEDKPGVDSIVATTAENSGQNSDGDVIKVRFSERMIHYTLSGAVAGGISGNGTEAAAAVTDGNDTVDANVAANNYFVTITRDGNVEVNNVAWGGSVTNFGGRAVYDTNDPTHKTILLLPGTNNPIGRPIEPSTVDVYRPGDNVEIRVATTVLDPAGNSVDSSDDDASANAS
jgi:hypothetical protein